jgi:protein-S-isoprenylcysteine O-methyltransferase Ste14
LLFRIANDWIDSGRVTGVLAAVSFSFAIYFTATRKSAVLVDPSWPARAVAVTAALAPLFFRPEGQSLLPDRVTSIVALAGGLVSFSGLMTLRRAFGILPAYRGEIVQRGVYGLVRHPLYTGYLVTHFAFTVAYFSVWNLLVWLIAEGSQLVRLQ